MEGAAILAGASQFGRAPATSAGRSPRQAVVFAAEGARADLEVVLLLFPNTWRRFGRTLASLGTKLGGSLVVTAASGSSRLPSELIPGQDSVSGQDLSRFPEKTARRARCLLQPRERF